MHRDLYVDVASLSGHAPLIYSTRSRELGARESGAGEWGAGSKGAGSRGAEYSHSQCTEMCILLFPV